MVVSRDDGSAVCPQSDDHRGRDGAESSPEEPRTWREVVDETYGDDVERFYEEGLDAVLDESLDPRGPDVLFDIAADLVSRRPGTSSTSDLAMAVISLSCGDGLDVE